MAIQFQMRRGTDVEHTTFTGAPGEVTVDVTNDTLVLHDGTTAGGFPLARASNIPTNVSQLNNDSGFITSGSITETDPIYSAWDKSTGISITESQISDFGNYLTSETVTSLSLATNILSYTNELGATSNIDLSLYLDDTNLARLVNGTINGTTGIATFTRDDASTFTVDFSALLDDVTVSLTGSGGTTVTGTYPNFTIASTSTTYTNVSELVNDVGYLTSYTETDPVFTASAASSITSPQITNWNTAYSWGDHSGLYSTVTQYNNIDGRVTTLESNASGAEALTRATLNPLQQTNNTVTSIALDVSTSTVFAHAMSQPVSFSFVGASPTYHDISLILTHDGTAHNITWPINIYWPNGSIPVLSSTAGSTDILSFVTADGGQSWYGVLKGNGFNPVPIVFNELQKAIASDGQLDDRLGRACAISDDGNTLVVSATHDDDLADMSGAVYVFERSGGVWIEQQKILPPVGDAINRLEFGRDVAISADGNTLVAGGHGQQSSDQNAGAVYVFTRSGGVWTQQQKVEADDATLNDRFGYSVDMSSDGNNIVVGAYSNNTSAGAAYVFTRSGSVWTQQQKLQASDLQGFDYLGVSVSMSSNGSTVVAGAYGEDTQGTSSGAAYVFTRSGSVWTQQQKLQASNGVAYDNFGWEVKVSGDGDTVIVGSGWQDSAGPNDSGAMYIFTRSLGVWIERQIVTADVPVSGARFGNTIASNENGTIIATGIPSEGVAYVFARLGSTWTHQQRVEASDGYVGNGFGASVSMSRDGNILNVGASTSTVNGSIYIFSR